MFIGGGVANVWNNPHEEEFFYKGYGNTKINKDILAYYRHERIVEDIAEYCQQLLLRTDGGKDREVMNAYELTFSLDSQKKIIVSLKDPLTLMGWCDAEPVLFLQNNNIITLANGPTYFNIRDMRDFLKKALNHELLLHKSITSDIGYLLNGYHKNEKGFIAEHFENGLETWVGYKYHLWYAYENETAYVTWIYNDNDENIIFEITPSYPYFSCDPKKQHNYVPFKKWMLSYQPYLIAKLSRETAQQWLEQAEYIVKTVDDNINRWREEYKD